MAHPKKPDRVLTDEELGVVSSGPMASPTDGSEAWTDESRKLAKPVPMPKVIVKDATAQPSFDGTVRTTKG